MSLPPILDVMTLNVWGLPWPFARERARRFARLARHFAERSYHLIGVQEAFWPRRIGIPGLRYGPGWPDSGLAVGGSLASSAELDLLRFERGAGSDRLAGKGVLRGRLGETLFGVTHLQAGAQPRVRLHQIEQLVHWFRGGEPAVLLGDFNLEPDERDAEAALRAAGFRDVATGPTWVPRNPFTGARAAHRFDRVWTRGPFRVRSAEVMCRVWSDHQPVHVSLELVR